MAAEMPRRTFANRRNAMRRHAFCRGPAALAAAARRRGSGLQWAFYKKRGPPLQRRTRSRGSARTLSDPVWAMLSARAEICCSGAVWGMECGMVSSTASTATTGCSGMGSLRGCQGGGGSAQGHGAEGNMWYEVGLPNLSTSNLSPPKPPPPPGMWVGMGVQAVPRLQGAAPQNSCSAHPPPPSLTNAPFWSPLRTALWAVCRAVHFAIPSPHPSFDSGLTPWSPARATAPSPGRPTPGVVQQDKSSGGSVDTTKTRSDPQRVRMSSGERPMGAAKGTQPDAKALCRTPPPPQRRQPPLTDR